MKRAYNLSKQISFSYIPDSKNLKYPSSFFSLLLQKWALWKRQQQEDTIMMGIEISEQNKTTTYVYIQHVSYL